MTTTLSLVLSMSLSLMTASIDLPQHIAVDINFCEFTDGGSENICDIRETETTSNNRIFLDANQQQARLFVDKRSVTSEKARYIFSKETIKIENRIVINMPYIRYSLLIRPGSYEIEKTPKGYMIYLAEGVNPLAAN